METLLCRREQGAEEAEKKLQITRRSAFYGRREEGRYRQNLRIQNSSQKGSARPMGLTGVLRSKVLLRGGLNFTRIHVLYYPSALSHWLGVAHRKCCFCVNIAVDSQEQQPGGPFGYSIHGGRSDRCGLMAFVSHLLCHTALLFHAGVGSSSSRSHGPFPGGKTRMGISGTDYRLRCCGWSCGVTGT